MLLKISLKWGLYLGLSTSIGTQILTWLGLGLTNWFVLLTFVLVTLFIALGLKELKTSHEGQLRFIHALSAIIIIVLISRYIFQGYMYIYINYIDPEWVNTVADSWSRTMLDSGMNSTAVGQRIMAFRSAWEPLNIFTIEVVKYGIAQVVIGMVVAVFFIFNFRKKKVA